MSDSSIKSLFTATQHPAGGGHPAQAGGFPAGVELPVAGTDAGGSLPPTGGSRAGTAEGGSLGNTAKFVSPPPLNPSGVVHLRRAHRFYLQSMARRILVSQRVERVGKMLVERDHTDSDTGEISDKLIPGRVYSNPKYPVVECLRVTHNRKDAIAVDYSPRTKSAHYANLRVCGRLWQCPVCAAKISEGRRQELSTLVECARGEGFSTFMVTYTLAHGRGDLLGDLLAKLTDARRFSKMGKSYDTFKKTYQIIGSVRSLELTYGKNGWHPHVHELMISAAPVGSLHYGKIIQYLKERWGHCAGKFGFDASWEHGLDVGFVQGHIDDYLSKFGRESSWTDAHEITKQVSKVSRSVGGTTPFGLLDAYGAEELVFGQHPARLFLEYVEAMHGKKQLFWSGGLRKRFALGAEVEDSELAVALPDDRQMAVLIDLVDWSIVTRYEQRAEILNRIEAADGNPAGVVEFINHLRNEHLGKV